MSPRVPCVLFVCTANICRSAFAHALARSLVAPDRLEVRSAGTHAPIGRAMDPIMVSQLADRGVVDPAYQSRRLDAAVLKAADVVLTMTVDQRTWILDDFPQHVGKVYTLAQFVDAASRCDGDLHGFELIRCVKAHRGLAREADDVVDPYGTGAEPTAAAAAQIERHLGEIVPRLALV